MPHAVRLLGHLLSAFGLTGMLLAGTLYVREQAAQESAWLALTRLQGARALTPRVTGAAGATLTLEPPDESRTEPAASLSLERATPPPAPAEQLGRTASPPPTAAPGQPITWVRLGRIGLDAEVVQAKLVEVAGGTTWEVPAFRVGHGEHSAGAGEEGNAVLLGHVTSLNAGNVFRDLHRARLGDEVWLAGGDDEHRYVVVEVRAVSRTDVSVLGPRPGKSVSLITCTGAWLPALNDYAERLVVRAELADSARS